MKKIYLVILVMILCWTSCRSYPDNFDPSYTGEDTKLDSLIDIQGYYVSQHGCDSTFFSMYMFYPDGLFTIATVSRIYPELVKCFEEGGENKSCKYPLWGVYTLVGDTIKTQTLRPEIGGDIVFRDYLILPDKRIANLSDYVDYHYSNMGYMANYPSFRNNTCLQAAHFFPLSQKRDIRDCPYLKKKWFWKK